mmetsp:Transcript_56774/g.130381  ORF Transcript_56774/g.130381 Transcript_56774/m.130381 type:complete len:256 (+) Transcript_56774:245-1012(+)
MASQRTTRLEDRLHLWFIQTTGHQKSATTLSAMVAEPMLRTRCALHAGSMRLQQREQALRRVRDLQDLRWARQLQEASRQHLLDELLIDHLLGRQPRETDHLLALQEHALLKHRTKHQKLRRLLVEQHELLGNLHASVSRNHSRWPVNELRKRRQRRAIQAAAHERILQERDACARLLKRCRERFTLGATHVACISDDDERGRGRPRLSLSHKPFLAKARHAQLAACGGEAPSCGIGSGGGAGGGSCHCVLRGRG